MHELSIAKSVIDIVENALPREISKPVTKVFLKIGILSGIEIDALEYSFSILKEKSRIANSQLIIELIKGEALCNTCNKTFEIQHYGQNCPVCKNSNIAITQGKEMKVIKIETE